MDQVTVDNTPNEGRIIWNNLMTSVEGQAHYFVSPAYAGLTPPFFASVSDVLTYFKSHIVADSSLMRETVIHVGAGIYTDDINISTVDYAWPQLTFIGEGMCHLDQWPSETSMRCKLTGTIFKFSGNDQWYMRGLVGVTIKNMTFIRATLPNGMGDGGDVMTCTNCEHVVIDGCSFIGTMSPTDRYHGLCFNDVYKAIISNCKIIGNYHGLALVDPSNVVVTNIMGRNNYYSTVIVKVQDGELHSDVDISNVTALGSLASMNQGIVVESFNAGSILKRLNLSNITIKYAGISGVYFGTTVTGEIQDVNINNIHVYGAASSGVWISSSLVSNININNLTIDTCTGVGIKNDGSPSVLASNIQIHNNTSFAREMSGPIITARGPQFLEFIVSQEFGSGHTIDAERLFRLVLPSDDGAPSYNKGNGALFVTIDGIVGNNVAYNAASLGALSFHEMYSVAVRTATGVKEVNVSPVQEHFETACAVSKLSDPYSVDQIEMVLTNDGIGDTTDIHYTWNTATLSGTVKKPSVFLRVKVIFYGFREAPLVYAS